MFFSAKRFFGIPRVRGLTPYSADIAGNPSEQAFFEVAIASFDDSQDPTNYRIRVEIEYITLFTEPKVADSS